MKKIFYIALAAATLIGCSKSEANYSEAQQISFMPVSKVNTKVAVTGAVYSENYPFYVYANAKNNDASTFITKYFEKVSFVPDGTNKTGGLQVYKGSPAQYWPNVNPLVFAGFTQTGNVASITPVANQDLTSLTLSNFTQPEPTVAGANDLMYFFADNDGNGYDKNTTFVDPTMKHACSWITINIKADQKLLADRDDNTEGIQPYWPNLKVKNVKFYNLHETGDLTITKADGATWNFADQTATQAVNVRTSDKDITTAFQEFAEIEANTIVLPQPLADNSSAKNATVQLSVTYSYTTPAGTADFTEEKVLDLFYDGDAKSAWQPGKHYTYNLTLTAEEIKIAPSSTDWDSDLNNNSTADDNIDKPF